MQNLITKKSLSLIICALIASQTTYAGVPPDPFIGSRHLLTVKFDINKPITDTASQFLAVRRLLIAIDNETEGRSELHPEKNIPCDVCHIKDNIQKDHIGERFVINESNPERSCTGAGCHDIKTAGKMPFYVKSFASIDETKDAKLVKKRLAAAKTLIQYTKTFKDNLLTRTTGLPVADRLTITIRAQDKKTNNLTKDVPLAFFEPTNVFDVKKDADLLPVYASTGLANDLFAALGQDMTVPTSLGGTLEVKTARAEDLEKHLAILDNNASILDLLTNLQFVFRYLVALPDDAINFVATELTAALPSALIKPDKTSGDSTTGIRLTKTWEIPAVANDGKNIATITLQINKEGSQTQPSTQLTFQKINSTSRTAVIQIVKKIQDHYTPTKADYARYTLTYTADAEANKKRLTDAIQNSKEAAGKGELRRNLTHSENTKTGTISTAGGVITSINAVKASALANPAGIRQLRSSIRYKSDLITVSQINNEVINGSLPRISIATQQQQLSEASKDKVIFTVSRETATVKPLTVYYSLSGTATAGKDYTKPVLSAKIPANATSINLAIKLINDKTIENDESLILTITPKNEYTLLTGYPALVNILDDDRAKP